MATYLSKYIKLSTQPWTGNGITNPTETITIDGVEGSSSVLLSQENSELYLNNVPISAGGGGVSSITTTPPLTVSQSIGEVVIDMLPIPGVDTLNGGPGISINQPTGDVTLTTYGGVTNLIAGTYDLNIVLDPTSKVCTVDTFANLATAVPPSYNLPTTQSGILGPLTPPNDGGLYFVSVYEANTPRTFLFPARRWGQSFRCGGTFLTDTAYNTNQMVRAYTLPVNLSDDELYIYTGNVFSVGTYLQINYFRIL